ncbi:peptidase dimerization domain-containing protein, partial [Mesorhizobium sp. M1C.F.Ca.ET.176.01.1.1]
SPGLDVGKFAIADGPILAALDEFDITIRGRGGHAAIPHLTIDPVVIGAQIILGLQTLVSRYTDPTESLVISVTKLSAAQAYNIIPDTVELSGTVRTLLPSMRDFVE